MHVATWEIRATELWTPAEVVGGIVLLVVLVSLLVVAFRVTRRR